MKKIKITAISLIALAAIVLILLNNKSKMEAKSRNDILRAYPVSVINVSKQKLSESLSLVGTIVANNDVAIVSETQGRVTHVFANVGDYVSANSPLVQVDDELKQANYATAEVNFEKAKKDFERIESLSKDKSVTDAQLDGARLAMKSAEAQFTVAKRMLSDTKITSPISGIVSARTVDVGTMIQNANVIANVVDISKLKVKVNVAEKDVFKLKVNDEVEITTDVYPGIIFNGKIATLGSKGDDAHTYPVEISLPNSKEHPLKAGMFGRISFISNQENESLTIPRDALVGSLKNPQVFIVENGIVKLRNIIVDNSSGTNIAIRDGLREGETIVVNGQNNLRDGVAVTIIQ
ncbi:MAG: efflux RND transporter periplasmic adaptor subunit [Ignavibacteriales bacterium]|nr:efflux RND transporter periplasmic adaptor subunit [Ignavibacteriales bacterium]